ncbi:hypothetical protein F0U62_45415 [Cystobacter fuscus]|uniref:hypothetical protein n=1 Tax=Cystobacter fuscus TaxID=43 RepID=UPI002B2B6961|nr:hypothetical protein F0U62_45415 [Cystobacter fuscus]
MSTTTYAPRDVWNRAWALSPALTVKTVLMFAGAVSTALLLAVDERQLVGEPLWLKPFKFYVSLTIFEATLLYFFSFLPERRRFLRRVGVVIAACGYLEMVAITLQAARGVRSHFNTATPFDQAVFSSMGIAITVMWVTVLVFALVLLRSKLEDRVLASTLRMGLLVTLVGMGLGFFMTTPHGEQLETLASGERPLEVGAHTFGGRDGGPGLPLVGWSRTAGDMRPAHFVGMHALQVLPLLALGLARRKQRSESRELAWVRAAGVGYLGLTLVLGLQALRGQSIVSWDATGLASLGAVVGASLLTLAAHPLRPRAPESLPPPAPAGLG